MEHCQNIDSTVEQSSSQARNAPFALVLQPCLTWTRIHERLARQCRDMLEAKLATAVRLLSSAKVIYVASKEAFGKQAKSRQQVAAWQAQRCPLG